MPVAVRCASRVSPGRAIRWRIRPVPGSATTAVAPKPHADMATTRSGRGHETRLAGEASLIERSVRQRRRSTICSANALRRLTPTATADRSGERP